MRFGIRNSFDTMDQFEPRFRECRTPIELALPYRMTDYQQLRPHLAAVAARLQEWGTPVLSVHAPQGRLQDADFPVWATEVAQFAAALGVGEITLHPSRYAKDAPVFDLQRQVVLMLARLQAQFPVTFALETFEGGRRIFSPGDIMRLRLPMVLDVAHIRSHREVMAIVAEYQASIVTVHLSGKASGEHHLPIDGECLEVVRALRTRRWSGSVILEYLPAYHDRLKEDLAELRGQFSREA